jgi:tetratricopeptide (TPR) repeat protein
MTRPSTRPRGRIETERCANGCSPQARANGSARSCWRMALRKPRSNHSTQRSGAHRARARGVLRDVARLFVLFVMAMPSAATAQTGHAAQTPPAGAAAPAPANLKAIAEMIDRGQAREAEQRLRQLVAQPGFASAQALLWLARLQTGRQDTAGALDSLRKARVLAPNSEEVLSAFAQVSLRGRAYVPAITALESLARLCPTVAQNHYLLGVGLMEAGVLPAAEESLRLADRLEPNRLLTLVALGLVLNGRKQYADAQPVLLRGLDLEPENVDAIAALAEAEAGLGDLTQAEVYARRALANSAKHATANLVMGTVLMKQEHYAEARDALETAVAADPDSAKAHYQLSLAYARLGDDTNAQKQVALYQQTLRDAEERAKALHRDTGLSTRGTRP